MKNLYIILSCIIIFTSNIQATDKCTNRYCDYEAKSAGGKGWVCKSDQVNCPGTLKCANDKDCNSNSVLKGKSEEVDRDLRSDY